MPIAVLLLTAAGAYAQTEVNVGVMRGKDYGVTYILPKTEIELTVEVTKHTYTPGEFNKYAERYLRLNNLQPEARVYWTLDKVETSVIGVPDKDKVYFVKLKDKTVAPLMELTHDGIVRSINLPYSGGETTAQETVQTSETQPRVDPRTFLTEEILLASSSAKMAELVAKEIYYIRESKNALLRGEADNMPSDGAQLKIMLDNLNIQEKALYEMFAGHTDNETKIFKIRVTPQEMKNEVAFRFSTKLGIVDNKDLAGSPAYISITDLKTINLPPTENDGKKVEGIAYNAPGRALVEIKYKQQQLFKGEVPVSQFGTTEYLAPSLFNKTTTTTVLFDTSTGGLLKVDRGE